MTSAPVKSVAVFGNGLAGLLCVAKLTQILPDNIQLTYIESHHASETDIFFGTAAPPTTYDFFLGLGIHEPDFLPSTNTSFSLGTRYENWGPNRRGWTQSFHRPLPAYNGVAFQHYLTRLRAASPDLSDIEHYIMSVEATKRGVFAHPPEGKNIPLADVEYGYHFLPEEWCKMLSDKIATRAVSSITADIVNLNQADETIESVILSDGQTIEADFFIDALGEKSRFVNSIGTLRTFDRTLRAVSSFTLNEQLIGVSRVLTATDSGWQSETPLQNGTHHLSIIYTPESDGEVPTESADRTSVDVQLGRLENPWSGNCLTLGHGAARVDPLTVAPILLLQRDIERLAELLPMNGDMTVESREYNRRFNADYDHAKMFSDAFFVANIENNTPYWKAASDGSTTTKLLKKIQQFESRGVTVQYDYEPFSAEDWTLLHLGMGRYPKRYDPLADHIPIEQLKNRLTQMNTAIKMMAKKMPPHHIYMSGLLKYLKDKHG